MIDISDVKGNYSQSEQWNVVRLSLPYIEKKFATDPESDSTLDKNSCMSALNIQTVQQENHYTQVSKGSYLCLEILPHQVRPHCLARPHFLARPTRSHLQMDLRPHQHWFPLD